MISVCLALTLSIPCTLITIAVICHKKNPVSNDSDEISDDTDSASSTSSSSYSIPDHHRHSYRHNRSHYAAGFLSPPPPYTATAEVRNPTSPPPYEPYTITVNARLTPPAPAINNPPIGTNANPSSIIPRADTTLDTSSSVTNQSIQTFQV